MLADEHNDASLPKLLYIMGTARSGSTVLEVLLSSDDRVTGLGELTHFPHDGILVRTPCGCGREVSSCPQWGALGAAMKSDEAEDAATLFRETESHRNFLAHYLRGFKRASLESYRAINRGLVIGVSNHAKDAPEWVVDSSKYAGRALALAEAFPGSVHVVCLVRDPVGLQRAFAKEQDDEQRGKSAMGAFAYHVFVLTCLALARRRLGGRMYLTSYEKLSLNPSGELAAIERWCGIPLSVAREVLAEGGDFSSGHIMTGNRIRKQARIRFQPTRSSERVRLPFSRRLAARVAAGWARVLGLHPR